MKMMTKVFLVALLVAAAVASPAIQQRDAIDVFLDYLKTTKGRAMVDPGNANDYIDLVLANLNPLLPADLSIPDIGGLFNLHDCYVFGLDNGLQRSGDATMITVEDTVKFSAAFAMHNIGVTCTWKELLMSGQGSGSTEVVDISSSISLELTSGSSPVLTEFRVTEMAKIQTDITGLTIAFNWLAEDIANVIINSYGEKIQDTIETVVRDLMQYVLDQIVVP